PLERRVHEVALRLEVVVDRARADLGVPGHIGHAQRLVPLLADDLAGRPQDLFPALGSDARSWHPFSPRVAVLVRLSDGLCPVQHPPGCRPLAAGRPSTTTET